MCLSPRTLQIEHAHTHPLPRAVLTVCKRDDRSSTALPQESKFKVPAPKARNMIARSKHRAQRGASPLDKKQIRFERALKVRNNADYFALSVLSSTLN